MYIKKQLLPSELLDKLSNLELTKEAYDLLNLCIKECGVSFETPENVKDYIPFRIALNIRTGYKNTQVVNSENKAYILIDEQTQFVGTAGNLYDICCLATMTFIEKHYKGDLPDFLFRTDVIPLGAFYNTKDYCLYLITQLYVSDVADLSPLLYGDLVEKPIDFNEASQSKDIANIKDLVQYALSSKFVYCLEGEIEDVK